MSEDETPVCALAAKPCDRVEQHRDVGRVRPCARALFHAALCSFGHSVTAVSACNIRGLQSPSTPLDFTQMTARQRAASGRQADRL
jgi:hypothetical protein